MRRRVRVVCIAVLAGLTVFAGCSEDKPDDITFERGDVPDEVFTDFVTQESDSGRAQWKLTAPKASRYIKKKIVLLEKPVIEFYKKDGTRSTVLESEAGEYSEETRDMLAYGNVVVRSVDGDVLETDSLLWNNEADKILSNSFVKLIRGRDVVTGWGLECDPNLNAVDIKRDVKATIIDEDGEIVD